MWTVIHHGACIIWYLELVMIRQIQSDGVPKSRDRDVYSIEEGCEHEVIKAIWITESSKGTSFLHILPKFEHFVPYHP